MSARVRIPVFRLITTLLVAGVVGCSDATPARIVTAADTLIINTTMVEPLDVHVVNRQGLVVPGVPIHYALATTDSTLVIRDGNRIQCRKDGVTRVALSAGKLTSSATVRCNIIEKIVAERVVCTRLGDPPPRLSVAAFDRDGNQIQNPRLYIISDSSFVRIANGMITPLKAGDGDVDYTNGRHRAVTLLRVLDTAAIIDSSRIVKARNEMFEPVCAELLPRRQRLPT